MEYKTYKISELFDIHPTKAYKYTNAMLFSKDGTTPVVTNTSENHGRAGFSTLKPTEHDIITFSDTGTKSPESFYYQKGNFIGYPHVQGMYPYSRDWTEKSLLYVIALLRKQTSGKYDYCAKMTRNDILNIKISLPTKNGNIDFQKIESFIDEIEAQYHNKKLEFIKQNKLMDYNLSAEEKNAMQLTSANKIKYKNFVIDSIFEKIETTTLKIKVGDASKTQTKDFPIPALTAGIINQGLSCFVPSENATILNNVISVSANGANTGRMFYQPYDFTVLQDSYAIRYKFKELTCYESLFFVTALQKCVSVGYDWTNKAGWNKVKKLSVMLPVDENDSINFSYMNLYISALQKNFISNIL